MRRWFWPVSCLFFVQGIVGPSTTHACNVLPMAEIYRWQDAVRAAQQWQSVRPFDPNSYLAIIKGSLKLGNVNRAELAWNKLVRLQPVPSARLFACWINALDEEGFHKQAQHQKLLAVEHGIDVSGLSHNFDVGEGVFQGCQ